MASPAKAPGISITVSRWSPSAIWNGAASIPGSRRVTPPVGNPDQTSTFGTDRLSSVLAGTAPGVAGRRPRFTWLVGYAHFENQFNVAAVSATTAPTPRTAYTRTGLVQNGDSDAVFASAKYRFTDALALDDRPARHLRYQERAGKYPAGRRPRLRDLPECRRSVPTGLGIVHAQQHLAERRPDLECAHLGRDAGISGGG